MEPANKISIFLNNLCVQTHSFCDPAAESFGCLCKSLVIYQGKLVKLWILRSGSEKSLCAKMEVCASIQVRSRTRICICVSGPEQRTRVCVPDAGPYRSCTHQFSKQQALWELCPVSPKKHIHHTHSKERQRSRTVALTHRSSMVALIHRQIGKNKIFDLTKYRMRTQYVHILEVLTIPCVL
jgi:hypothetical protein